MSTLLPLFKKLPAALAALTVCGAFAQGAVAPATMPTSGATPGPRTGASAAGPNTSSGGAAALTSSDRRFVEKAAAGGMAEATLGSLAQQRASNDQVKQFGERMAQDHGKANQELKSLAERKGLALPASTDDRDHQKDAEKFKRLSGSEFDRAFMAQMVADHKKTISLFEDAAQSAKDPDVKAFAGATLPTLREHLQMAQRTSDAVKK